MLYQHMIFFIGTLYPNVRTPLKDVSNSQMLNLSSPLTMGSRSTKQLASDHAFQTRKNRKQILANKKNRPTFSHSQSQETSHQPVVSTPPNAHSKRQSIQGMTIVSNTSPIQKPKSHVILLILQLF